jgi:CheY-like chemotaxis protein
MNKVNVLVASSSVESLSLLKLDTTKCKITFVNSSKHLHTQITTNKFDLIFLDNKLGKLDNSNTLNMANDFRNSILNKHTTVICFGANTPAALTLANFLRPKSIRLDPKDKDFNKMVETCIENAGTR